MIPVKYFFILWAVVVSTTATAEDPVNVIKDASDCEICRVIAHKLQEQLEKTGSYYDVVEKGYDFERRYDTPIDYRRSQLRFIESTESICQDLYVENMEWEKKLNDSSRIQRPDDIQKMKMKCDQILEKYDAELERWYNKLEDVGPLSYPGGGGIPIVEYLCERRVLRRKNKDCLPSKEVKENEDELV